MPSYRVTDVSRYLGRGLLDYSAMTRAVHDAIEDTLDGGVVYFPHGTYFLDGVVVRGRDCLTLCGDGCRSILKWVRDPEDRFNAHMMEFNGCSMLTIRDLAFHGAGFASDARYTAIVGLYSCRAFRVEKNRFLDDVVPLAAGVHVADMRPGITMSDANGTVADNYMRYYGLQVGASDGVEIVRNTIREARHAAIEVLTASRAGREHRVRDLRLTQNTILDPVAVGIDLKLETQEEVRPVTNLEQLELGPLERVRVVENLIRFSSRRDYPKPVAGIRLEPGAGWGEPEPDDIVISDNHVICERDSSSFENEPTMGITVESVWTDLVSRPFDAEVEAPRGLIRNLVVARNLVVGFDGAGLYVSGVVGGTIGDNGFYDCATGLRVAYWFDRVHIHSNRFLGTQLDYDFPFLGAACVVEGNVSLEGNYAWPDPPVWEDLWLPPRQGRFGPEEVAPTNGPWFFGTDRYLVREGADAERDAVGGDDQNPARATGEG